MAVRIWFSAADLAATVVAAPDPFAETLAGVIALREGHLTPHFAAWQGRTARHLPLRARPVADLWPGPGGPSLDLLTVVGPTTDLDEGLSRLWAASRASLDAEIEYFARARGRVPAALGPLLHHDRRSRSALCAALRSFHDHAIEPHWLDLRARLELARRTAVALQRSAGTEALIASLGGSGLRWSAPVLQVDSSLGDVPVDVDLGGRGLVLMPSVFFGARPMLFRAPERGGDRPDTLVYQVPLAGEEPVGTRAQALTELVGATRAAALRAIAHRHRSTGGLARVLGVSAASASEQAAVLRRSGLVRTVRDGRAVRHEITDLGLRLVAQQD